MTPMTPRGLLSFGLQASGFLRHSEFVLRHFPPELPLNFELCALSFASHLAAQILPRGKTAFLLRARAGSGYNARVA
jgi:hypothetical protein